MDSHLALIISSFCVANFRNSRLLRAIRALNLKILDRNLLRPELIRGSLRGGAYFLPTVFSTKSLLPILSFQVSFTVSPLEP